MQGSCECGAVRIEARGAPAARLYCHCKICQEVYGAACADVTVLWSHRVKVVEGTDALRVRRYQWLPASLWRGVCRRCERSVLGRLDVPPIPPTGVTFVPTPVWGDAAALPAPSGHIYYHSRVADVDDALPKARGVVRSQLAATSWILPRLFGA